MRTVAECLAYIRKNDFIARNEKEREKFCHWLAENEPQSFSRLPARQERWKQFLSGFYDVMPEYEADARQRAIGLTGRVAMTAAKIRSLLPDAAAIIEKSIRKTIELVFDYVPAQYFWSYAADNYGARVGGINHGAGHCLDVADRIADFLSRKPDAARLRIIGRNRLPELFTACMMHDIASVVARPCHNKTSAYLAAGILSTSGAESEFSEAVKNLIVAHNTDGQKESFYEDWPEACLLHDADKISASTNPERIVEVWENHTAADRYNFFNHTLSDTERAYLARKGDPLSLGDRNRSGSCGIAAIAQSIFCRAKKRIFFDRDTAQALIGEYWSELGIPLVQRVCDLVRDRILNRHGDKPCACKIKGSPLIRDKADEIDRALKDLGKRCFP